MLKKSAFLAVVLCLAFAILMLSAREKTFSVRTVKVIAASPSEIWGEVADVSAWPAWWPGVESSALRDGWREGGPLGLVLAGDGERRPARILRVRAQKEIAWERIGILRSTARTTLSVEPVADGARVRLENSIRGPQAVLARVTGKEAFARYQEEVLRRLEERVAGAQREAADAG